jgi:RNA polymerase sigma-70 factor (ECF subfamily)
MTDLAGQSPTDAAVMEDSWHDPERFALIYHRYFTEIYRYLARRVGTPGADDLAAEVFLTAFAGRERYDLAYSSARPWLYGIATRLLAAHFRQERRFTARSPAPSVARCRRAPTTGSLTALTPPRPGQR